MSHCAGIVLAVVVGSIAGVCVWIRILLNDYKDRCRGGQ
jgi:hypothetical protein